MNRKTLLGRFASSFTAAPAAVRPEYTSVRLEALEDRKMLALTTFVNDNWVNTMGGDGLQNGDMVTNTNPNDGAVILKEYGFDAFGIVDGGSLAGSTTIYDAIQNTSSGGTLTLLPGTFTESDIVIDRPMRFEGTLVASAISSVIVPEATSADVDGNFSVGTRSGIIIYSPSVSILNLKVDGSGNTGIGANHDYHQGITTLYDTQNGGDYSSLHNGVLPLIILGTPGGGESGHLNASVPQLEIDNVNVTNTYWHGVTISPLFNRNFDTGEDENFNLNVSNSSISNVGIVQDSNRIGVLLQNLNDEEDTNVGNARNLTISNVGVGIKSAPYGDNNAGTYGDSNRASNQSYIRFVTVNDPVVTGFEIIDGSRTDSQGWKAIFSNPVNNGTGISLNRSRSAMGGAIITNAKIGVHVQNSPLSIPPLAGDVGSRHPSFLWDNYLTGPGVGVAGSVGVLVDTAVGDPSAANIILGEQMTITGYQVGVKAEQTTPSADGLKNTLFFNKGRIYGNGTDVVIGQNSVGNGRIENALGFAATNISLTSNGKWDGRTYDFDIRDPFYWEVPGNTPDGSRVFAQPNAEESLTGNVNFSSGATYSPLLTGETNSAMLYNFNSNATYPFSAPPDSPVDGVVPQPYGALFNWFGNVTQNDGTLTVGGSAYNGYQYEFLFGTNNVPIVGGPNNGKFQLVPTDISDKTHLNFKIQLLPTNVNKTLEIGLLDFRGNVMMYTIDCTELSSSSYTVVSIPILSASIDLTGQDSSFDLKTASGWVLGGDQGVANGLNTVPVGFKLDEITTSSVPNSKLVVTGTVTLGSSNLNVTLPVGYTPTTNQTFTIIDNDAADAVVGTFVGAAEGATVTSNGHKYQVTYVGGTGNDVVITYKGLPIVNSTIAGRHIFYNQSVWDGNSAAIQAVPDNAAIAMVTAGVPKTPHLPGGGVAVAANITSFSRGINGIMVDLSAGVTHTGITAADFVFKVGNNNSPNLWAAAPAPSAISVIPGGGVGGADRVEITWASGVVKNQWLEVQVLPTVATGLLAADVHFWGNKIADSASSSPATTFETTATDAAQVFGNLGAGKPITDLRDYNRDGAVTATDASVVFANLGNITRISIAAGGPFAPDAEPAVAGDGSGSAVASALAARSGPTGLPKLPGWIASRLSSVDLNSGPMARLFTQLAEANTPRSNAMLAKINQVTDALGLDDALLESLIAGRV